jgi:hypothetical protein
VLEPLHEEVVISTRCQKDGLARRWSARAELTASSLPGVVLAAVAQGESRSKAARTAVDVVMGAYESRRPKRFRGSKA